MSPLMLLQSCRPNVVCMGTNQENVHKVTIGERPDCRLAGRRTEHQGIPCMVLGDNQSARSVYRPESRATCKDVTHDSRGVREIAASTNYSPRLRRKSAFNFAGDKTINVLPLTETRFCSRNFASVREKVSLTVPSSAASTRLVMVSSMRTGCSPFLFGRR